jgi:LPXTG-motif cell wall-anchored protein
MRIRSKLRILPVLLGLSLLLLVPAARAAETLLLSCTVCNQLIATGSGLPANETVKLTVTDVKTGQQVGPTHSITTDSQGLFVLKIPMDLSLHQSVESTVLKSDGQVMVVAAHNRFTAPCKDGKMEEMSGMGEMGEMGHEGLAFTGSHAPQLLALGGALLVLGAGLILGARRRRLPH